MENNELQMSVKSGTKVSCGTEAAARMASWSSSVLAAEARKVGIASEVTSLTPRPPSRTGMRACVYCESDKEQFVIALRPDLRRSSKVDNAVCSKHGACEAKCGGLWLYH